MSNECEGRLLIVDDETELRHTLCETLAKRGYSTTGFGTGSEALAALAGGEFDLLLSDLMMPEMDGIELLGRAQAIDPHLVGIIMTGHGTVQTAVDAMKLGAFDYLLKPFRLQAVLPTLQRAIGVRRLRLENVELRQAIAIYELTRSLAVSLDLEAILDRVADAALSQAEADEVSIMLPSSAGDELCIALARGERPQKLVGQCVPLGSGIAGWVARHQELLVLRETVNDERFAPLYPRSEIASALSLPMVAGGALVGVLNINRTINKRTFTAGQVKAMTMLTGSVAFAIENARLFDLLDKARATAEESSRLKDEFLATVSHELRTPMTAVLGWSHLLQQPAADETPLAQGMRVIHRNAVAQCQLIDDLLDVSRIVAGKLGFHAAPTDVRPIVAEVIEAIGATIEARHQQLSAQSVKQPLVVQGDARRLRQIVWNLVSNAAKFTPEGGVIGVQLCAVGDQVRLVVSDNGRGITREFMPHLFDRFRQGDGSATRSHGGLGLGLAIVHHLVEMHGGTIEAHSAGESQGSSFTVLLPLLVGR